LEVVNANFIGALALYQQRRDSAIGLGHITIRQHGLLWYYNTLQRNRYIELTTKAYHLGVIRSVRKRMKELKREIKSARSNELAQVLCQQYIGLQEVFNKSVEVING
jgi:hypothetical protein